VIIGSGFNWPECPPLLKTIVVLWGSDRVETAKQLGNYQLVTEGFVSSF
jgi:hypothetical protein